MSPSEELATLQQMINNTSMLWISWGSIKLNHHWTQWYLMTSPKRSFLMQTKEGWSVSRLSQPSHHCQGRKFPVQCSSAVLSWSSALIVPTMHSVLCILPLKDSSCNYNATLPHNIGRELAVLRKKQGIQKALSEKRHWYWHRHWYCPPLLLSVTAPTVATDTDV